jgi:hypothetical protein
MGHHYLPRCYLKGFSKSRKQGKSHQVHVYDRSGKTFIANITKIAAEKDFNRVEVDGYAPDAFEKDLAKFESELGPALIRILNSRTLNSDDDRLILFNFIARMAISTPRQREATRVFHERLAHLKMGVLTATRERWEHRIAEMRAHHVAVADVPYEQVRRGPNRAPHPSGDWWLRCHPSYVVQAQVEGAVGGKARDGLRDL